MFGSHTFAPISWMCKKQTAVSHSNAESEIISLDAGSRVDGLSDLQLRKCVLETSSSKPALTHILTVVFLSQCTTFYPTFPTVHTQPNSPLRRQCGSDPNDQQGTKPKPEARHKNAQSRFGLVVEEIELGSMLMKYVRTTDQLADILTK